MKLCIHSLILVSIICYTSNHVNATSVEMITNPQCENLMQLHTPFTTNHGVHVLVERTHELLSLDFNQYLLNLSIGSAIIGEDLGVELSISGIKGTFHAVGGSATTHVLNLSRMMLLESNIINSNQVKYIYEGMSESSMFYTPQKYRVETVINTNGTIEDLKIFQQVPYLKFFKSWKQIYDFEKEDLLKNVEISIPRVLLSSETSEAIFNMLYYGLEVPDHEFSPYFEYRDGLFISKNASYIEKGTSLAKLIDAINGVGSLSKKAGALLLKDLFTYVKKISDSSSSGNINSSTNLN